MKLYGSAETRDDFTNDGCHPLLLKKTGGGDYCFLPTAELPDANRVEDLTIEGDGDGVGLIAPVLKLPHETLHIELGGERADLHGVESRFIVVNRRSGRIRLVG